MKKTVLLMIMLCTIVTLVMACSKKEDSETIETDGISVGDMGEYEYEGVTFSYVVKEDGVVINNANPDYGKKIIFPDCIENYEVISVSNECKIRYEEVYMPSTVDKIEKGMFKECGYLKYVDVKNVTDIEAHAFANCILLETVVGNKIQNIGQEAFYECSRLESITLSDVQEIDKKAFYECSALKTIDIRNVEKIGELAFGECSGLKCDIVFEKLKITAMGEEAFLNCGGLNGKTIIFKEKQEILEGDIWNVIDRVAGERYFYGTSVQFEGIDSVYTSAMCGEGSFILLFFGPDYWDSVGCINTSEITCSGRELYDSVSDLFSNRIVRNNESLSLKEISDIIDKIKENGKITNMWPFTLRATKYRLVDALAIVLEGENPNVIWGNGSNDDIENNISIGIDKKVIYDEAGNIQYKYETLNNDMLLINISGKDIYFKIEEYHENDEGADFCVYAYIS